MFYLHSDGFYSFRCGPFTRNIWQKSRTLNMTFQWVKLFDHMHRLIYCSKYGNSKLFYVRVINEVNRKSVDERHDIKNDIFGFV